MPSLSKKRLDAVKVWEDIEQAVEDKTVLEGVVTEENKGGIVVSVKGVRVFVPASQSGHAQGRRPEPADQADAFSCASPRSTVPAAAWSAPSAAVHRARPARPRRRRSGPTSRSASTITGTVKSMTSYGVFVDIGGVDGMVHISELSWSRIKNPAEVVKVGDTIDVYVISFDPEKHKISLGVQGPQHQNPWDVFMNKYQGRRRGHRHASSS